MNRLRKRSLMHAMLGAAAAWGLTFGAVTPVHAVWSEYAFISSTMGVSDSRICIGEASRGEIGCPSYAPTVSPTGRINAAAGLTVDSVSLTTTGTTWGYLGSTASYLPNLSSNAVSATNISATTINGVAVSALGGASPTNVPAFRANLASTQTLATSTLTKLLFTNEQFDTHDNYNATSARFTPTVAGYYLVTVSIACDNVTSGQACLTSIYKNGSIYKQAFGRSTNSIITSQVVELVYMNGSTDYIEGYGYSEAITATINSFSSYTSFSATLVASGNGLISGTGATALSGLTDVTLASPATGQVLTYNGTRWVNATPSATTVISGTTTMVNGWPDAVKCTASNGGTALFYLDWKPSSGDVFYSTPYDSNAYPERIRFTSAGAFSAQDITNSWTVTDCNKSISQLYADGQAFNFIGNSGAGGGSALGDRITSGTLAVTANSSTAIVSLSTNGTTWGYLGSIASYLPTLNTSAISATAVQISSNTAVTCGAGNAGTLRYNSSNTALELCTGSGWQVMGVGIPAGTISAFASTTCPTGWSEYTPARGRFLRGIDNGAGNDSDGTRVPGATQSDTFKSHTHNPNSGVAFIVSGETGANLAWSAAGSNMGGTHNGATAATGESETRPKNVAVTFCQFNGTSNGWNNPLSGGSTVPGGNTGQIQYNSAGAFTGSAGLTWDNAASRLTATNISATSLTVNGVAITGSSSGDRITSGTTSAVANAAGTIDISGSVNVSGSIKLDNLSVTCTADKVGSIAIINGRLSQCRL